jgi:hypothetical protein
MADPPSVTIIPLKDLRQMFNELEPWELVSQGILREKVMSENPPKPGIAAKEPPGTVSQIIRYIDRKTGRSVAIAHRYLHPDGSIGASGRPDPKRVVKDGVIYEYRGHR